MSKSSLVFTQLKASIRVFSKILTCLTSVGRAIQHLLLSLWTHPLSELAELHLRELYLKTSCRREKCSNISHNIMYLENYRFDYVPLDFLISVFYGIS